MVNGLPYLEAGVVGVLITVAVFRILLGGRAFTRLLLGEGTADHDEVE